MRYKMSIEVKSKYEMGDIIFVKKYSYQNDKNGENHLFVIIDDEDNSVSIEYFGWIVSSHREKANDVSNFKYNEPLDATLKNGLKKDSIVKCDQVYNISKDNVAFKIGSVDVDDFYRFMITFQKYIYENNMVEI